MQFSKDHLTGLTAGKIKGDLPPFSAGNFDETEAYLFKIAKKLPSAKGCAASACPSAD